MRVPWLLTVVVAAVASAAMPAAAVACSCVASGVSACAAIATADAVFEGTVESVTPGANRYTIEVTFSDVVTRVGPVVSAVSTPSQSSACGINFQIGERYLVVARTSGGGLSAGRCGQTTRLPHGEGLRQYAESLSAGVTNGEIWGRISMNGRPVPGTQVQVAGPVERLVMADDEGHYRVTHLPDGRYQIGVVLPPSLSKARAGDVEPFDLEGSRRCAEVDLRVSSGVRVRGTIADENGNPARGVPVELRAVDTGNTVQAIRVGWATRTDSRGRYEFSGVLPGRYVAGVNIGSPPSVRHPFASAFIRGEGGEWQIDLALGDAVGMQPLAIATLPVVELQGVVLDAMGLPVGGARVYARGAGEHRATERAQTAEDGSIVVRVIADSRYRIWIGDADAPDAEYHAVAENEPFTLILPARLR